MGKFSERHDLVSCPLCHSKRVERWMRNVLYPNDPMTCECGFHFRAGEIAGMFLVIEDLAPSQEEELDK